MFINGFWQDMAMANGARELALFKRTVLGGLRWQKRTKRFESVSWNGDVEALIETNRE